ncbi:hypothetical protein QFZ58_000680 [Streptomyces sp. B1I3]|nr:hypothetical protein [Streptomyces sp. B1I3]
MTSSATILALLRTTASPPTSHSTESPPSARQDHVRPVRPMRCSRWLHPSGTPYPAAGPHNRTGLRNILAGRLPAPAPGALPRCSRSAAAPSSTPAGHDATGPVATGSPHARRTMHVSLSVNTGTRAGKARRLPAPGPRTPPTPRTPSHFAMTTPPPPSSLPGASSPYRLTPLSGDGTGHDPCGLTHGGGPHRCAVSHRAPSVSPNVRTQDVAGRRGSSHRRAHANGPGPLPRTPAGRSCRGREGIAPPPGTAAPTCATHPFDIGNCSRPGPRSTCGRVNALVRQL